MPAGGDDVGTAGLNLCGRVWARRSSTSARLDRFVSLFVFLSQVTPLALIFIVPPP